VRRRAAVIHIAAPAAPGATDQDDDPPAPRLDGPALPRPARLQPEYRPPARSERPNDLHQDDPARRRSGEPENDGEAR
jgi:hypothetical protein